jgi:hypothetical protein
MIMAAIGALLVMALFPETVAGQALHRYLVELPVRQLARIKRRQLIFAIGVFVMVLCASEIILLAGSFDLAILYAWDASLYVDALIALSTLAATTRLKSMAVTVSTKFLARPLRQGRRLADRAKRRPRRPSPAAVSNDEEPHPAYAMAT